jgi:ribosomal protein S3
MGQKTNPNILRIGKIKEWKSKYIEKKSTESSTVIFRDLEMKKFIFQIFAKNGLKVQNCRLYYSENSLHVYISYYNYFNPLILDQKIKQKYMNTRSKTFQNKIIDVKKSSVKKQLYIAKDYNKRLLSQSQQKLFQDQYFLKKKTHRSSIINSFKNHNDTSNHRTINQQRANLFISKILKGLVLFTCKKHDVFLNLKQINKETIFFRTVLKNNKRKLKENIIKLRKFQQSNFFKKGFNTLNTFTLNANSSSFLAEFIASTLQKLKRPNFFLRFLKIALKSLLSNKFTEIERVQIKIKGRFNGAPRSNHKFINIGRNIPVLTLKSKIDYGESTAYTSNGTFGIKVWTYIKS